MAKYQDSKELKAYLAALRQGLEEHQRRYEEARQRLQEVPDPTTRAVLECVLLDVHTDTQGVFYALSSLRYASRMCKELTERVSELEKKLAENPLMGPAAEEVLKRICPQALDVKAVSMLEAMFDYLLKVVSEDPEKKAELVKFFASRLNQEPK